MDQLVAARPDPQTARSFWTMRRGDSERAFRAARSHSRAVRLLRLAVPLAMTLSVFGFVLWTWFNPLRLLAALPDVGGNLVVSGTKITMQEPRINGFTRDQRPYEFNAKAADQDMTKPDLVDLRNMWGKIDMKDKSVANIVAQTGTYNSKTEMLQLGRGTVVTSTSGYKVLLDNALIDVRNTKLVTEDPVHVEMKEGVLDAKRMEVLDSGNTIRFNDVKMDLKGDQVMPAGAKQQPQQGTKQQ